MEKLIRERDALTAAAEVARKIDDKIIYQRMETLIRRCPAYNEDGTRVDEETTEDLVKRRIREETEAFLLPRHLMPKEVRVTVLYDGTQADLRVRI